MSQPSPPIAHPPSGEGGDPKRISQGTHTWGPPLGFPPGPRSVPRRRARHARPPHSGGWGGGGGGRLTALTVGREGEGVARRSPRRANPRGAAARVSERRRPRAPRLREAAAVGAGGAAPVLLCWGSPVRGGAPLRSRPPPRLTETSSSRRQWREPADRGLRAVRRREPLRRAPGYGGGLGPQGGPG